MFYLKSKSKKRNLLMGIILVVGLLFSSIEINQPTFSSLWQYESLTQKVLHIDNKAKSIQTAEFILFRIRMSFKPFRVNQVTVLGITIYKR